MLKTVKADIINHRHNRPADNAFITIVPINLISVFWREAVQHYGGGMFKIIRQENGQSVSYLRRTLFKLQSSKIIRCHFDKAEAIKFRPGVCQMPSHRGDYFFIEEILEWFSHFL